MASATSTKVVPLISSDTAGPLGAVHLPRLWAKLSSTTPACSPTGTIPAAPASTR